MGPTKKYDPYGYSSHDCGWGYADADYFDRYVAARRRADDNALLLDRERTARANAERGHEQAVKARVEVEASLAATQTALNDALALIASLRKVGA